jgi:hypothetical protein
MNNYEGAVLQDVYEDMYGLVAGFTPPDCVAGALASEEADEVVLPFYDALLADGANRRVVDVIMFKAVCDSRPPLTEARMAPEEDFAWQNRN